MANQRAPSNSGCFVSSQEVVKIAKDTEKKKKVPKVQKNEAFGANTETLARVAEKLIMAEGEEL